MAKSVTTASGIRRYQLGRSNAMIKVSRYNASGTTHSSGTTATSVETWFVVAISATDANAGRISQSKYSRPLGALASAAADSPVATLSVLGWPPASGTR